MPAPRGRLRRPARPFLGSLALGGLLMAAACTPPAPAPSVPTESLSNVTLEWTFSDETNTGSFNGQCNFMSAGRSDGFAGTYAATAGDATVLKLTSSGSYVPISNYADRCKSANGTTVTATGAARLGQKVRLSGGAGTYAPSTGATTVRWDGAFSINFYGTLVPFWIQDPKLTIDSSGAGTLTATVGGYASSQDDPDVRVPLADRSNVVVATLGGVANDDVETFTASPAYAGVAYDSTLTPQNRVVAGWGSWPRPFVAFQEQTGLGSYWYTTGSSIDVRKPPAPIVVDLNRP